MHDCILRPVEVKMHVELFQKQQKLRKTEI